MTSPADIERERADVTGRAAVKLAIYEAHRWACRKGDFGVDLGPYDEAVASGLVAPSFDAMAEAAINAAWPVLRRKLEAAESRIQALEEANARKDEALKPFAEHADKLPSKEDVDDDKPVHTIWLGRGRWKHVTLRDFRRARTALTGAHNGQ